MKYKNPVIKGFYPDPSVCFAEGKYYLVSSSFQYFPGVPVFESDDLVNWKQTGCVLTRTEQVHLDKINSSGGVFAPTIRYNNGRFYMVTTNDTTHENFYLYTDDIHGEWSKPITVRQDGIDPSLLFDDDGHVYFISNGTDDHGEGGVVQCEIDIETGKKLSESRCIWKGSGGRFLESPHMYKINDEYYLMAAEGGTEYGHMITYARSKSVWGEFESYPHNPVLTNRNKAPYIIQGIGHGDLICDKNGRWHILCLGFRQEGIWIPYHHLGREVFLIPVTFGSDGWFTAGIDRTADSEYETEGNFIQEKLPVYTFENTDFKYEWAYLRKPRFENYTFEKDKFILRGSEITLDDVDSPTFTALRQRDFKMDFSVDIEISEKGEGGITVYMCENEHCELSVRSSESGFEGILKLNIGGIKHIQKAVPLTSGKARLVIRSDEMDYRFYISENGREEFLGSMMTKYLSSEVSGGFTGVMTGLYAVGDVTAEFTGLRIEYTEE